MKLKISNREGKSVGDFELADDVLVFTKGQQALQDYVVAYQAHQRAGTASTLTKGEVAGSNKKPWRQKGTGRARAGYRQSPIWRGGGVAFGPKPRAFSQQVNRKVARLAFRRAFSERIKAEQVTVLEEISVSEPKTRQVAELLMNLKLTGKTLVVVDRIEKNLGLAARNLPGVKVATAASVNAFDLVKYPRLLVSRAALTALQARLAGKGKGS
jgi:large subunit ribosomal protein L4